MGFWTDPPLIRLTAYSINIVCSVILTLHVILIPQGIPAQNDVLYAVVTLNLCTFLMFVWATLVQRSSERKRRYLMESHFNFDFTDVSGVTEEELRHFDEERAFKLKKAKDLKKFS